MRPSSANAGECVILAGFLLKIMRILCLHAAYLNTAKIKKCLLISLWYTTDTGGHPEELPDVHGCQGSAEAQQRTRKHKDSWAKNPTILQEEETTRRQRVCVLLSFGVPVYFAKTIGAIQHKYSVNVGCPYLEWKHYSSTDAHPAVQREWERVVETKHCTGPGWTEAGAKTSARHSKASRCACPNPRWDGGGAPIHANASFSPFIWTIQVLFSPQMQISRFAGWRNRG